MNSALTVLTACESGRPGYQDGEGMVSLAHAFNYAGSQSILTALWKIDERSTATIMDDFSKKLLKGMPKDEALQQAKLDYYNTSDGAMSPNYWAHLIVIGDPSPLYASPPANTWVWIIAGGCLVCVVCALMMAKKGRHKISVT